MSTDVSDTAGNGDGSADRRAEIAANLARLEERIAAACAAAGRHRADLTLVAVTKTFPASDVGQLAALGIRDVGENRDQEAAAKVAACREAGVERLVWHFVGQLQRNKAGSVATYADVVHSVDRRRLVPALDRAAGAAGRRLTALVQVDLRDEPVDDGRGGAAPSEVAEVAAAVAAADHLTLGGVMAVAPMDSDPDAAFARLAEIAGHLHEEHPHALAVSAGMSGDLEAAIRHGATHLRVGSALLGSRPPLG
jgi:pyridoxal phosphate enzyme (YggS family)